MFCQRWSTSFNVTGNFYEMLIKNTTYTTNKHHLTLAKYAKKLLLHQLYMHRSDVVSAITRSNKLIADSFTDSSTQR